MVLPQQLPMKTEEATPLAPPAAPVQLPAVVAPSEPVPVVVPAPEVASEAAPFVPGQTTPVAATEPAAPTLPEPVVMPPPAVVEQTAPNSVVPLPSADPSTFAAPVREAAVPQPAVPEMAPAVVLPPVAAPVAEVAAPVPAPVVPVVEAVAPAPVVPVVETAVPAPAAVPVVEMVAPAPVAAPVVEAVVPAVPIAAEAILTNMQIKPEGIPNRPLQDESQDYFVQLEPPGPHWLFCFESELALQERMRQEAMQRSSPDRPDRIDFPVYKPLTQDAFASRAWDCRTLTVEPSYVIYRRPYFEELNGERYAWDLGLIGPVVSSAWFYKDLLLLPYHIGSDLCCRHESSAGYCLPGDAVPYMLYPPRWSVTGGFTEIVTAMALVAMFP